MATQFAPIRSGATSPTYSRPPTADAFPKSAGSVLKVSKRDNGIISPVESTFSFYDDEEPAIPSFSTGPDLIDEKQIARHVSRGAPGDAALAAMVKRNQSTREGEEMAKRNTQFYGEVFAYREPNLTTREKISKFSVITAEVKTNVIVRDEYTFLNDLSQQLSQRYQRPASSIFITLDHSACLLFAGTFDSAYIMTLTALPSQLQSTTNKRNAALLQTFMTDALGVVSERGIIRFSPIAEENLATNGTTVRGEIERLSRTSDEENTDPVSRSKSRRSIKPKDLPSKDKSKPGSRIVSRKTSRAASPVRPTISPPLTSPSLPAIPTEKSLLDRRSEKAQKMGRTRSFLGLFGRK